jgi:hypothetical protein
MLSGLSTSPSVTTPGASAPAEVARPAAVPAPPSSASPSKATAPQRVLYVESSFQPTLGLVILEFRDSTGAVVDTIPDAQKLASYRRGLLLGTAVGSDAQVRGTPAETTPHAQHPRAVSTDLPQPAPLTDSPQPSAGNDRTEAILTQN